MVTESSYAAPPGAYGYVPLPVHPALEIAPPSAYPPPRVTAPAPASDVRAAAFDALPIPGLLVDESGTITACNAAMAALAGLPAGTLAGRPWWQFLRPDDGAAPHAAADRTGCYVLRGATGERTVTVRASSLDMPMAMQGSSWCAGRPAPLLLLVEEDVPTDTVAAHDGLLLDAAHELRSPLLSFNLALDLLGEENGSLSEDDERRLIETLRRSTVHLQTLVENLLNSASMSAHQFNVTLEAIDAGAVVCEAITIVDPLLGPNDQRVVIDVPPEGLIVYADAQRLRQVLVNLLHNAVKYSPRHDTIAVRARHDGAMATVAITNHGPCIPVHEQPFLFHRFFRGRGSCTPSGTGRERGGARVAGRGNGLGLAIARTIIQAHGGEIGVRSAPAEGTTFWFTVPMV